MKLFTVTSKLEVAEGIDSGDIKIPYGEGMMKLLAGATSLRLKAADIARLSDGTLRIIREANGRSDRHALVFVPCPPGAQLRLFANTVEETFANGAVVRTPRPFEAACGVFLHHQDEQGALITMMPRASFRLSYEGRRPEKTPPQGVVLWSGRYDPNRPTIGLSAYARTNRI